MLTWGQFRQARPDLAEAGKALFYQFSVGLAFLGTVRPDGGPRVHPVCPQITDDGIYAFVIPSPKRRDLLRDGRYALHGFPPAQNEDAIYLTGRAEKRTDPELRASLTRMFLTERNLVAQPPSFGGQLLFEFLIESCLVTRTTGHGDHDPKHSVWRAG